MPYNARTDGRAEVGSGWHVHSDRPHIFDPESRTTVVVGRSRGGIRDAYHFLLSASWWLDVSLITATFLGANVVFACAYALLGGVANARPGSFVDAFFFSVQTMGTIGYGEMHPVSLFANLLVTCEAVCGLLLTALATGLVFAKFSAVRPRVVFSRRAVVTPLDGVPTLMLRIANERGNYIASVEVRLTLMRTERTREGRTLYRMRELVPVSPRSPAFSRGLTVMHTIDASSPLNGATADSLRSSDAEIIVTFVGIDGTTGQYVHARGSYLDDEILFNHHLADMVTELPDGRIEVNLRHFNEVEPDVS
jgi:inward rectifier potassium channel